jgi:pyruvate,orthophosphate dikinase
MFFEEDRIGHIRSMILADSQDGRREALARLLPMQRSDFYEIFKAMDGLPVTIRTLDPPLHEFLPHTDKEIEELAEKFHLLPSRVKERVEALKEQNPMLGLRGCRLGILYPEITAMQARAVFEAAAQALGEGVRAEPEIMIPLVGHEREFILQKEIVDRAAEEVMAERHTKIKYLVGTMIELPRAALVADKIAAAGAEFFSFGTNDLTQTTYGLSRDDSGSFLGVYQERGIWSSDPFVTVDQDALGQLIKIGVEKGRGADPKLKIGICGEHGGDPPSVKFCSRSGFDYVSCSPHRVPLARLAAAQAAIEDEDDGSAAKKPASRARKASARKPAAKKPAARGRKPAAKKPAARKTAARKTAARKPAARKTAARKPAVRKPAARKTTARKTAARKPAVRKTAARKPAARKTAARKPAARKTAARKPAARKTAVRKPAARKPAARKTAARRK